MACRREPSARATSAARLVAVAVVVRPFDERPHHLLVDPTLGAARSVHGDEVVLVPVCVTWQGGGHRRIRHDPSSLGSLRARSVPGIVRDAG